MRCRGFGGATLDEVAAQADLTKGAVYDHFGSKENLLLALMEEYLAGQLAAQLALFDRERDQLRAPARRQRGLDGAPAGEPRPLPPVRRAVDATPSAMSDCACTWPARCATLHATFAGFASEPAPPTPACNLQPGPPSSSPT